MVWPLFLSIAGPFFYESDVAKVEFPCYSLTCVLLAAKFDVQNGKKRWIIQQMCSVVGQIFLDTTIRLDTCDVVYELL